MSMIQWLQRQIKQKKNKEQWIHTDNEQDLLKGIQFQKYLLQENKIKFHKCLKNLGLQQRDFFEGQKKVLHPIIAPERKFEQSEERKLIQRLYPSSKIFLDKCHKRLKKKK